MRLWAWFAVFALLSACGQPQSAAPAAEKAEVAAPASGAQAPDPAAAVRPIYDNYISGARSAAEGYYEAPLSASLRALWDRAKANDTESGNGIDFDPYINAQDYVITGVEVTVVNPLADNTCVLRARFTNIGRETEVFYDMVLEDGAWKINNVRSTGDLGEMNLRRELGER